MKQVYKVGDKKHYKKLVTKEDVAKFNGTTVHHVCSTFALAREIEWSTRLFVLDIKEEDEEGVGTMLTINHIGPAFIGEELLIEATIKTFSKNELICKYSVHVNDRLIAKGETGQKIFKKKVFEKIFDKDRK
ncbi:hypothetical protein QQ008_08430 [Fulvivirgaceae bacterium BMA10]|uniref:Fluoroacetyl-CoA-specific thioesterase-like domain-containing protein n=1 Tax=Splendidivirga corallicola TaxID=3051826 RepID=A0ABT8KKZ0_9BACT|nr:hypothetical protein [Fulvivirgaceae bacterium BMA10]